MYRALIDRDGDFEGLFWACVRTTGIFCRPTCRARKPKRVNVVFVGSVSEALHSGFRPCKICRPLEAHVDHPPWAAGLLQKLERDPGRRLTDADLRRDGIEPARARRYFKRTFGVTLHAFARAWRLGEAMKQLSEGVPIADAALGSGFDSESGFREAFARLFGTPPGRAKAGDHLTARWLSTPLGPMLGVASEEGLTMLEFVDRRGLEREIVTMRRKTKRVIVPGRSSFLDRIARELAEYFSGHLERFETPLDLRGGSDFQREVWARLLDVPYGQTTSYGALAAELGRPAAARAMGRANGSNQIAIVIPCHRVIAANGALTGYGGGLHRKRWLLDHERSKG